MYQKQEVVDIIDTNKGNIDRQKPERQIVVKDSQTLSKQEEQTIIWETKLVYDEMIFQVANNLMNLLLKEISHQIEWEITD
jgi:hypothetical protein